jgi:hypothetical protein
MEQLGAPYWPGSTMSPPNKNSCVLANCESSELEETSEFPLKKTARQKSTLVDRIKKVRVRGSEITLTYKIPFSPKERLDMGKKEFFTLSKMVVAAGLEPATSRM